MTRRNHGISMLPVVLLLGLVAAGGYNYHRNWQADNMLPRPYESYSQVDLEALLAAYESENAMLESRYASVRGRNASNAGAGMLDENIAAFERAQQRSSGSRALGVKLSMQQMATGEIETELQRREKEADVVQLHLKRLLTI